MACHEVRLARRRWCAGRWCLLRLAGSLKFGHATASLLSGKRSASSWQNVLAAALEEDGTMRRTIDAARYLADPACRREICRQLGKREVSDRATGVTAGRQPVRSTGCLRRRTACSGPECATWPNVQHVGRSWRLLWRWSRCLLDLTPDIAR